MDCILLHKKQKSETRKKRGRLCQCIDCIGKGYWLLFLYSSCFLNKQKQKSTVENNNKARVFFGSMLILFSFLLVVLLEDFFCSFVQLRKSSHLVNTSSTVNTFSSLFIKIDNYQFQLSFFYQFCLFVFQSR